MRGTEPLSIWAINFQDMRTCHEGFNVLFLKYVTFKVDNIRYTWI